MLVIGGNSHHCTQVFEKLILVSYHIHETKMLCKNHRTALKKYQTITSHPMITVHGQCLNYFLHISFKSLVHLSSKSQKSNAFEYINCLQSYLLS